MSGIVQERKHRKLPTAVSDACIDDGVRSETQEPAAKPRDQEGQRQEASGQPTHPDLLPKREAFILEFLGEEVFDQVEKRKRETNSGDKESYGDPLGRIGQIGQTKDGPPPMQRRHKA